VKNGAGAAVFFGDNPFSGGITLNQGILVAGHNSGWGTGAVTTSYFLSSRGSFGNKGRIFLGSALAFSVLFVLWGLTRSPLWFSVVQFFMAACIAANFITGTAMIQALTPDAVRGRVLSLFGLNQAIAMTFGVVVGAIAEAAVAVPIMGGVLVAAVAVMAAASPGLRHVH